MTENEINQIKREEYNKGKEVGIRIGVRYWEMNRYVFRIINEAAREKELSGKMKVLSDSQNYTPDLYESIKENPHSEELKSQQKNLEALAKGHGFVMTEKGIYLDNEQ